MSRTVYIALTVLAIVAGLWLRAPALGTGFFLDDYAQLSMLQGTYPVQRHPLDLFNFSTGEPEEVRALVQSGYFPWWTHPNLRLMLFRPLSSALIWADFTLFGDNPVPYHLHSILWWIVLVCALSVFLFEHLPRPIAAVAVWVFVLDEGHATLLGWLANRNALVSGTFGLIALIAHFRWRKGGRVRHVVLASVAYTLALLAGEYALCLLGYVFAHELLVARADPIKRRIRATLPLLVPGLAVVAMHLGLGYGSFGSDLYIDPFSEWASFLAEIAKRIPVFVADLLLAIRGEWWIVGPPARETVLRSGLLSAAVWRQLPSWQTAHVLIGVACIATLLWIVPRTLRGQPRELRATMTWMVAGTGLAFVPVAVALPTSRLMLLPLFGWCGLLGLLLVQAARRAVEAIGARRLPPLGSTAGGLVLAGLHMAFAPLASAHDSALLAWGANGVQTAVLEAELDPDTAEQQRALILATQDPQIAIYVCLMRRFHGAPTPRSCRVLSMAHTPHFARRVDADTLELKSVGGGMMTHLFERTFRTRDLPLRKGQVIELDGLKIEIVQTVGKGVRTVRYHFDRPLEDDALVFLRTEPDGLDRFTLPTSGETVRLPPAPPPIGPRREQAPAESGAGSGGAAEPADGEGQQVDPGRDQE